MSGPWDKYKGAAAPAEDGPWAKYADQGGPDEPFVDKAKRWGSNTLQALGKLAGVPRAVTTGPLSGLAMEAGGNGKVAFSGEDVMNALNPTNLKTFPSNAEMAERTGVKNPALSAVMPGYAEPGSRHSKWQPEKGGLLDPTLLGAVQLPTDPAMWMGGGEAGAAAEALAASRAATAGPISKGLSMAAAPARGAADVLGIASGAKLAGKAFDMIPGASTAVNPLGAALRTLGKKTYGAGMEKVDFEGNKYGKSDVSDVFFQAGAKTPGQLVTKGKAANAQLMRARGTLFDQATKAGAEVDLDQALQPGFDRAAKLRSSGLPSDARAADALEAELQGPITQQNGIPGNPPIPPGAPTTQQVPSAILGPNGQPIMNTQVIPGSPGVPGTPGVAPVPTTLARASALKTRLYEKLPKAGFQEGGQLALDDQGLRAAASGVRKGVIDEGNRAVPGLGTDVADLDQASGKILGTQKAQIRTSNDWDRLLNKNTHITGLDALTEALGGMTALAKKKFLQATGLATMPLGYAERRLGDTNTVDRVNEILNSNSSKKKERNPWER